MNEEIGDIQHYRIRWIQNWNLCYYGCSTLLEKKQYPWKLFPKGCTFSKNGNLLGSRRYTSTKDYFQRNEKKNLQWSQKSEGKKYLVIWKGDAYLMKPGIDNMVHHYKDNHQNCQLYARCKDTHYVESFNNAFLQYHFKRIVFGETDWKENVDRPAVTSRQQVEEISRTACPREKKTLSKFKENVWNNWMVKYLQ